MDVTNQYNTCPLCQGPIKRNGTTSSGNTRWRCKDPDCNYSFTNTNDAAKQAYRFRLFLKWLDSPLSLAAIAATQNRSRRQLTRWFEPFWFVQVPINNDPYRIYDQIFIDGTYFGTDNCLLVAATKHHVIAWHWCKRENAANYNRLFDKIKYPPVVVTTDGQAGALKAIKQTWPEAKVQRCLIHVKRNIQAAVGNSPVLASGKALKQLSLRLLQVKDEQQAAEWVALLQEFHHLYGKWLNEKTYINDQNRSEIPTKFRDNKRFFYTHYRHRKAYNLLEKLTRNGHLFTYLTSKDDIVGREGLSRETNSLEGGINAQIKALARNHRGMSPEHRRTAVDWWCYLHTEHPEDPVSIARKQKWGRDALKQIQAASATLVQDDSDGVPAMYDTGIEPTHTNDIGIRRGTMR